MCLLDPRPPGPNLPAVSLPSPPPQALPANAATGSRRRRLWELDSHAHCPVVGVCLPMPALRRLVDKTVGGQAVADDYTLHCGVVADCKRRSALAERVQRELDRRFLLPLRQAAQAKTTEALSAWWDDALQRCDVAGPFWATLTHPRCSPALEHQVLGQLHMLQHQAGMAARIDLARFEALIDENAVLARALGAAQQRGQRQADTAAQREHSQQAELVRLRAQCIHHDTRFALQQQDLQALEASLPDLLPRADLARALAQQTERTQGLERALLQARHEAERQHRRADALAADLHSLQRQAAALAAASATTATTAPTAPPPDHPVRLDDHAVLCVGGRPAAVPLYRLIVERSGGRFMHHDGGDEDSSARLDATLAAADLVICQTGCISHNAYWRVKDHCKRTGKRCVFVETPSSAGLKRALVALAPSTLPQPAAGAAPHAPAAAARGASDSR